MSCVAIITARGGSKRIPRKNIKIFMGRPMISYAIAAARDSGLFSEIIVSTDDEEIADVSRANGADVPFMRSPATSGDFSTTADVLCEVLGRLADEGRAFDDFVCIYPCVPFLTGEVLAKAYSVFKEKNADALMPVVRFSFPIQRAMVSDGQGFLSYREPENERTRTQDLEPAYHDAGMFYCCKTAVLMKEKTLVPRKTAMFELPETCVQDIDTMEDWRLAEMTYRVLKGDA